MQVSPQRAPETMIASTPVHEESALRFDARGISRCVRHAAILGALDALKPGAVMRLVDDHDPLPLLSQLRQRFGRTLAVGYVDRAPDKVVIDFAMTADAEEKPGNCGCCGQCG